MSLIQESQDVLAQVHKAQAQKQTKGQKKVQVQISEPSITPLVNHLNVIQHLAKNSERDVTFKIFKDTVELDETKYKKRVIDLSKNQSIKKFIDTIKDVSKIKTGEDEPEISYSSVTKLIFDPVLRGYLAMANIKWINKTKPVTKQSTEQGIEQELQEEQVQEQIVINNFEQAIQELGLPEQKTVNLESFLNAIHEYLGKEDQIKLKCYNQIFPLDVWKEGSDVGKINNKYIQRIPPFFDQLLKLIVDNSNLSLEDLKLKVTESVHKWFVEEYQSNSKETIDPVLLQLQTFVERFKSLTEIIEQANQFGDPKAEKQILDKYALWNPCVIQGSKKVLDRSLTIGSWDKYSDAILEQFAKLVSTIKKCLKFAESVIAGKVYQEKVTRCTHDLTQFYNRYEDQLHRYEQFRKDHQKVEQTVQGVLQYLVETLRFLNDLKVNSSTTLLPSEFNNENVIFKLTGQVAKVVKELVSTPSLDANAELTKLFADPKFKDRKDDITLLGIVQSCNLNSVDTYAKIGEYANVIPNVQLPKNIRVAIGLALVRYTLTELRVLLAANGPNRHSPITIYIKQ